MTSPTTSRKSWMLGLVLALGGALIGCGGASMSAKSSSEPAAPPAGAYPQAGYQQPGEAELGASADAAPATAGAPMPQPKKEEAPPESRKSAESRPGLGTSWGETRNSRITTVPFHRADASSPFATASVFYNDAEGARAMASGASMAPQRAMEIGGGIVTFGLKDGDSGRFLNGFEASGRDYVVGEANQRYVIVVQNHAPSRIEVVVSVDGLDVIDGKAAGFNKRGYLVDGNGTLEIDGFRQSEEAVAAFRFGSVRGSYANQKKGGDARNVGVIGVALFHEQGTTPALWRDEVNRRNNADPFPGRFATPPGG
jgi:hypothetical protein